METNFELKKTAYSKNDGFVHFIVEFSVDGQITICRINGKLFKTRR